jgi:hypothetical protein
MPVLRLIIFAFTDGLAGSFRRLFNSTIKRRLTDKKLQEKINEKFILQRTGFELIHQQLQHRDHKLFDN